MTSSGIGRYLRTVSHLRPSQLYWRVHYEAERRASPGRRAARWQWKGDKAPRIRPDFPRIPLGYRAGSSSVTLALLSHGVLQHLNQQKAIGHAQPDWRLGRVAQDRLWTVTSHYHGWLYDLAEAVLSDPIGSLEAGRLVRHYLSDWLDRCGPAAPGARFLAWSPYAVASRLAWWIRTYQKLGEERVRSWGSMAERFLHSLWEQAAYLSDHVEWDLRGNHLLRNAAGLAWAGQFFDEPEARRWLDQATRIAAEQAAEQVLPDGGHFERSPMYHLLVMEDLWNLELLTPDDAVRRTLNEKLERMFEYLAWIRHPDGQIPLFNDAALNGACPPDEALRAVRPLVLFAREDAVAGGRYFRDTGMAVWHGDPWDVFFDVGPVGPPYQPGHAHADTLSIECSFRGKRLFVDPGTFHYDPDDTRRYDRSTAAHNTVCLDGTDSSEVWGLFRVGRRARPLNVATVIGSSSMQASASHDGYDHLRGRPRHTRSITVRNGGSLAIEDRIEGRGRHEIESGLLLAPEWKVTSISGGWQIERDGARALVVVKGGPDLRLHQSARPYHPEFGMEVRTTRLTWRVNAALPVSATVIVEPD